MGKYVEYEDSYKSLKEALLHGGIAHNVKVNIHWIEAESFEKGQLERELEHFDGILVPGGFGKRGIEGMINAIEYARVNQSALFRHLPGHADHGDRIRAQRMRTGATPTPPSSIPATPHRVIYKLRELKGIDELGGTMRLGAWPCVLKPGSLRAQGLWFNRDQRAPPAPLRVQPRIRRLLTSNGSAITGETPDGTYVEICEIENHPYYLGCQFHPEFKSKPLEPHPLFVSFIGAVSSFC